MEKIERQSNDNEKAEHKRSEAETKRHEQRQRQVQALSMVLGDFAKVAAGAGAVIGAAMLAMAESVRKGIGEFDRLYYVSGRTGASVNGIKALGYAFKQTVRRLRPLSASLRISPERDVRTLALMRCCEATASTRRAIPPTC